LVAIYSGILSLKKALSGVSGSERFTINVLRLLWPIANTRGVGRLVPWEFLPLLTQ
jgi:hypothetical protein